METSTAKLTTDFEYCASVFCHKTKIDPVAINTLKGCAVEAANVPIQAWHLWPNINVYAISNLLPSSFVQRSFLLKSNCLKSNTLSEYVF